MSQHHLQSLIMLSGRYLENLKRTLIMPTTFFMARMVQVGRWRSTVYAGKISSCPNILTSTNMCQGCIHNQRRFHNLTPCSRQRSIRCYLWKFSRLEILPSTRQIRDTNARERALERTAGEVGMGQRPSRSSFESRLSQTRDERSVERAIES